MLIPVKLYELETPFRMSGTLIAQIKLRLALTRVIGKQKQGEGKKELIIRSKPDSHTPAKSVCEVVGRYGCQKDLFIIRLLAEVAG